MKYFRLLIPLIMVLIIAFPVYAATITDATWRADVRVVNTGGATTKVATVFTLDTDNLINNNYFLSDFSNVCVLDSTGADVAYMPARSTTDKWCTWVPAIGLSGTQIYRFYSGGPTAMNGKIRYFPGAAGVVTNDGVITEFASDYEIELKGYFNMTNGNYFYHKENAFAIRCLADNQLDWGAGALYAFVPMSAPMASGEHTVKITTVAGNAEMFIDGVSVDTVAGAGIPNEATNYVISYNSGMPYIEYVKTTVSGTLEQHLYWENAAVLTDHSGLANHPASSAFRNTTSNGNVTATFTDYHAIATAVSTYTAVDTAPMITAAPAAPAEMYTENDYSNIPGADAINAVLTAGDIPLDFFWIPAIFILSLVVGFVIFFLSRSLLGMALASGLVMGAFALMGPVPLWCVIPFIIFAFATIIKRENPGGY